MESDAQKHVEVNDMGYCTPYISDNKRVAFQLLDIDILRLRIEDDIYDAGYSFTTETIFDLKDKDADLFRRAVIAADKSLKGIIKDRQNIFTALLFACKPCDCKECPSYPCEEMEDGK